MKPARKKKDALPEIKSAINIAVRERQDKDHKKKTYPADRFYHQIGIMDGGIPTNGEGDAYSLAAK